MATYDAVAEAKGDKEWEAWLKRVFGAMDEIGAFVAQCRRGEASGIPNIYRGSFNFCVRVTFKDGGPDAIIRFPKPGHTAFREEKVAKEVEAIRILQEKTTIPLPRLISWGSTAESPRQLGPFIITEFASGTHLSNVLRDPTEPDGKKDYLDPNIDDRKLDFIYDQLADFAMQILKLNFNRIGAISKNPTSNIWSVIERPLTYSMNELVTSAGYPIDQFPTWTFECVSDYLRTLTNEHMIHLRTQRNLVCGPVSAKELYIARHLFAKLIPQYCIDDYGPFKLFCDDLRPQNMLVDPDTLRITAVLDLEFTNAMPAQFAYDPPWWLLLVGPETWLQRGRTMEAFVAAYKPRMEQFVRAIERAEARSEAMGAHDGKRSLSSLMRESWDTGRFWFDYAARKPFHVDGLFYTHLNEGSAGVESLDDEARAGLEPLIQIKIEQLRAYDKECAVLAL